MLPDTAAFVECQICNEFTASKVRQPCGHGPYCSSCVMQYAEVKLAAGLFRFNCPDPGCDEPMHDYILKSVYKVPESFLDKLHNRSVAAAAGTSSDLFACPSPDCPMVVAFENCGSPCRYKCPLCNRDSCFVCGQPWHGHNAMTCVASALDPSLVEWMHQTGSKQCPRCKTIVTKQNLEAQGGESDECHKMQCRCCGARFCFKCLTLLMGQNKPCACSDPKHGFADFDTGDYIEHKQDYIEELGASFRLVHPALQLTFTFAQCGSRDIAWEAVLQCQREIRAEQETLERLARPELVAHLPSGQKKGSNAELVERILKRKYNLPGGSGNDVESWVNEFKKNSPSRQPRVPPSSRLDTARPAAKRQKVEPQTHSPLQNAPGEKPADLGSAATIESATTARQNLSHVLKKDERVRRSLIGGVGANAVDQELGPADTPEYRLPLHVLHWAF